MYYFNLNSKTKFRKLIAESTIMSRLPEDNSYAMVNLEHTIACHALSPDKPFYDSF